MSRGRGGAVALLSLAAACSNPSDLSEEIFAQNRLLWENTGPASYTFDLLRSCVCEGPAGAVRIVVENGAVTSRTLVSDETPLPAQFNAEYPGIDGLFQLVENALRGDTAFLSVGYDSTYGYPGEIIVDYNAARSDDNRVYVVSNFTPN